MSIGTSIATGLAVAGGVGALGSVAGAAISGNASESAASTEANADEQANQIQLQEFNQEQQNEQPYLQAGDTALSQLTSGTQPGGQFDESYPTFQQEYPNLATTFTAPTEAQAEQTPGYQFTYDQAMQGLQNNMAAAGITGGAAAKEAEQYGAGLASSNYQNTYNDAYNTFNANLTAAQNIYGQNFNTYNTTTTNNANRLLSLAGAGQNAVSQSNQAAQSYATNAGNNLTSAANAQAAGMVGAANAYSGALTSTSQLPYELYGAALSSSSYANNPALNYAFGNVLNGSALGNYNAQLTSLG